VIPRQCRIEEECAVESNELQCSFSNSSARVVYHEPSLSVGALAYLSNRLSRSFVSTAMSDRYGFDVFCIPTFAREKEDREPHGRVGRKFRTREV
jgi:hypothetical protein